ncbi:MAG: 3-ketoacyl-ACP reductase [Candidatus Aminicenantes bacterium]|nr:3-ketoacyl-ACP reductase [Candidatus Aminicenantes bacterium]NIM83896.1 3-ketoacyl-ACP reductase [Candidatus Aminicenantes bacterium]NIN23362.1 3-ketoacyl-ACP reductase [Candidatus Aminicenantes bacterium]NIN47064.1 3-ketoacyl-ACP reductase [Candidatus Aminicenantes bacterium]NIN89988.1 3-ketoacyl-ACP reductase [Candidatus Aminicenantes bacterium]
MNKRPVAVVTGASRGIGSAIVLELSTAGYDIVGISRTLETTKTKKGLNELKPFIEANGASFLPLKADISDIEIHNRLISEIEKEFGRIDVLVNNAGVPPLKRLDILETTAESFDRVLSINLRGPFFLTQLVSRQMLEKIEIIRDYHPKIIFITSISAEVSSLNRAEYCISKSGLSMAARVFAHRLAGSGINVYEIRPGLVQTDMTAPVKEKYDKLIEEGLIPMNRWAQPEDIARAVAALTRGDFAYSTGTIIEVSGGMNIRSL